MIKRKLEKWQLKSEDEIINIPVQVPSDVSWELYSAGLINDPLYGTNLKNLSWIAEKNWIYECVFDVDTEIIHSERIDLCFDGIDTLSEIILNGKPLGKTQNMFLKYSFSVGNILKEKDNCLTVRLLSATAYIREKNDGKNYRALFTQDRLFIRKAQCHWGWDWAPKLPGIGIWLPVYLEADDNMKIDHVKIQTFLSGQIIFTIRLNNGKTLFKSDNTIYSLKICVGKKCVEYSVNSLTNILCMEIKNPHLWQPNGYGESYLYEYKTELYKDGQKLDENHGKFGICEIKLEELPFEKEKLTFALIVNGRKIFCKGSNWVPLSTMTGAIEEKKYEQLLIAAQHANFNILRVWGGGIYEKECFYELCDRLGILVWQDFMYSCSAVPAELESMQGELIKEAEYQVERLQNHPCIALWCGGNEYMPHLQGKYYEKGNYFIRTILRGICKNKDENRIYIHNTPYGHGDDEWNVNTGDSHISCSDIILEKNDISNYRRYIFDNPVQFVSESAHLGPTRIKSLKKFISKESLWPTGEVWDYHCVKNPYSSVSETFVNKEKRFVTGLFSIFTSLEDFVKKGMIAQAEFLLAEIDFARSNPYCRGFMNWMYNDIWGCATWSIIDYYNEKKPAYFAMKRAFAPIRICFTENREGLSLSICNDSSRKISGIVKYALKKLSGEVVDEKQTYSQAEKDGTSSFKVQLSEKGDYYIAEFLTEKGKSYKTIFLRDFKNVIFCSKISWSVKKTNENFYQITIRAEKFARCVFIDAKGDVSIECSDNYFDMEKNEERTIEVCSREADENSFTVKTFADEWKE